MTVAALSVMVFALAFVTGGLGGAVLGFWMVRRETAKTIQGELDACYDAGYRDGYENGSDDASDFDGHA